MEKKVISLMGGSFFLALAGVVLFLWSLLPGNGPAGGHFVPLLLLLVGAVGLTAGWALHDVVERLTRLERGQEGDLHRQSEPTPQ